MEYSIKEAPFHAEGFGKHVADYNDLLGPDDAIILKYVGQFIIQPRWEITMHLWPIMESGEVLADNMADKQNDGEFRICEEKR